MTILQNTLLVEALPEEEAELCRRALQQIKALSGVQSCHLSLCLDGEERVTLRMPAVTTTLQVAVLEALCCAKPVTLIPLQAFLSIPQASELLPASPEFVRELLKAGQLPFSEGAFGPQIRYADLRDYQRQRQQEREQILRALMEETERLGRYDRKE